MQLFRGENGKSFSQTKPRLRAKHGKRTRAGAVGLEPTVFEDLPQQIEVLNHRWKKLTTKHAQEKEI